MKFLLILGIIGTVTLLGLTGVSAETVNITGVVPDRPSTMAPIPSATESTPQTRHPSSNATGATTADTTIVASPATASSVTIPNEALLSPKDAAEYSQPTVTNDVMATVEQLSKTYRGPIAITAAASAIAAAVLHVLPFASHGAAAAAGAGASAGSVRLPTWPRRFGRIRPTKQ